MSGLHRYQRQMPLFALIVFATADFVTGVWKAAIEVPPGSFEISGFLDITTASNAATSDTMSVGVVGTPAGYLAATSVKAAARTALTIPAGFSNAKKAIGITRTTVGVDTALAGALCLQYIQKGRTGGGNYGSLDGGPANTNVGL